MPRLLAHGGLQKRVCYFLVNFKSFVIVFLIVMDARTFLDYVEEKNEQGSRNYLMEDDVLPSKTAEAKALARDWINEIKKGPLAGCVLDGFVSNVNNLYNNSRVSAEPLGSPGTEDITAWLIQPNSEIDLRLKCANNKKGLEEINKVADSWFAVYNSEELIANGAVGFTTIRDVLMTDSYEPIGLVEINGERNAIAAAADASREEDIRPVYDPDREFYLGDDCSNLREDREALEDHIRTTTEYIVKCLPESEHEDIYDLRDNIITGINCTNAGPVEWDTQLFNKIKFGDKYYATDMGLGRCLVDKVYDSKKEDRVNGFESESEWKEYLSSVRSAHTGIFTIPLGMTVMSMDKSIIRTLSHPTLHYTKKLMSNIFERRRWGTSTFKKEKYWSKSFLQSTFSLGQLAVAVRELSNNGNESWRDIYTALKYNIRGGERTVFFSR